MSEKQFAGHVTGRGHGPGGRLVPMAGDVVEVKFSASGCDCNCGDAALRKADFTPVWLTGAQAERTAIRLTLSSEKRYFAFHADGMHCLAHVAGT